MDLFTHSFRPLLYSPLSIQPLLGRPAGAEYRLVLQDGLAISELLVQEVPLFLVGVS
jgi:hypothetical protein